MSGEPVLAGPPRSGRLGGILALLGGTLFWAGNYVVGGAAVTIIPPLDLTAMRWAIAALPLLVLAHVVERPSWRSVIRSWPRIAIAALLGMVAYNLLLYSALQHTTAVNASLINAFNPALIGIGAMLVFRTPLSPRAVLGIVIALAGVLWVVCDGRPGRLISTGFGVGDLLMTGAILAWTVYTLLGRRRSPVPPITATALQAVTAVVVLGPVAVATGGPHLPTATGPLVALIFIGVFPSVLSYLLWNKALTAIPPAQAGISLNLITVFTVIISVALGRPLTWAQVIGGVAVLGGVLLTAAPGGLKAGSSRAISVAGRDHQDRRADEPSL